MLYTTMKNVYIITYKSILIEEIMKADLEMKILKFRLGYVK